MSKVYVPLSDIDDFACYSVFSSDVIRADYDVPRVNSSSDYIDYYINSHYLEKKGSQTWGSYNSNLPVCIDKAEITNFYGYRNDFAEILIISLILIGVCWFIVSKLIKTLLKGRKRY